MPRPVRKIPLGFLGLRYAPTVYELMFFYFSITVALTGCSIFAKPLNKPVIDSVKKPEAHAEEWAIKGSKFTSPKLALALIDTGANVTLAQDGKIEHISPDRLWKKLGSPWAEPLGRIQTRNLGQAYYSGTGKTYNGYLKPLENSGSTKLFVSWRLKLSESPGHSKGSNKFIRIWDQTDGKGTRISWTQMHLTYNGSKKPSWGGWPGKRDQWNQMTLWVDSELGEIQALVNGKRSHDVHDFKKVATDKGLNIKLIGFDPSGATPYQNMKVEIDELYVSSTQARVVISDQADWPEAQSRQSIQVPTLWRDDEIRFLYQPADFLEYPHYLYVVNKYGVASSKGFPLTKAKSQPGFPSYP